MADPESVAARLRAVSTNRKWLKIVNFSQEQKFEYLSSYWMVSLQIYIVCALYMCLYVAKTLGADGKYFWVIFNFFPTGRKSVIFIRFSAEKHCFLASK